MTKANVDPCEKENRALTNLAAAARRVDLPDTIDNLSVADTVGKRIALARLQKEWTQMEFAKRLNKSRATIVQYERDNITPPIEVFEEISALLGPPPEFFAFGRYGVDAVKSSSELTTVHEYTYGRDGDKLSTAHVLSKQMLADFKLTGHKLGVYVLKHPAKRLNYVENTRVLVATDIKTPSRDHSLFLIRIAEGYDVVGVEPEYFGSQPYKFISSSGLTIVGNFADMNVVGAVVMAFTPV